MLLLLAHLAHAELPPPDYRAAMESSAAATVDQLARDQGLDAAARFVDQWVRQVGPSPLAEYELGLAWRIAGDDKRALAAFDRALVVDPNLVAARYDRGELRLNDGQLTSAEADFQVVVQVEPSAWPGAFRLADIAGRRGDAAAFETWLVRALRQGFPVSTIIGDPRWRAWATDPALGPVLVRLVTVYAGEDAAAALTSPVGP